MPAVTRLPRLLPQPIESLAVPDVFHPSSFAALETCPLSVLGLSNVHRDALLGSHPTAYLGTILHHVRSELKEGRWNGITDPRRAADALFEISLMQAEAELRQDSATAGLLPLQESVGRRRWTKWIADLRTWVLSLVADEVDRVPQELTLRTEATGVCSGGVDPPTVILGSEQAAVNPELRLRGRPDWSVERRPGQVEIVDYKSGHIRDHDGQLLDGHVVQMQLYALLVEAAFPEATVTLYLEQASRVSVPWGPQERDQVTARLHTMLERLPAGSIQPASGIASPGIHCSKCRLRPVCSAYLGQMPEWWRDERDHPRPLPLDVWGDVTRVVHQGPVFSLRMTDAASRRVRIDGLSSLSTDSVVCQGDQMWFFDLESSEDRNQHGAIVQPRNFHQAPPGPRWERARRLKVYHTPT